MKICVFAQTLNPKTGTGVLVGNIVDGVKKQKNDIEFSIMTREDYLKPSAYHILRNWFEIRNKIKESDLLHAFDVYPYGVIAHLVSFGLSKPLVITAIGSGSIQKLHGPGIKSWLVKRTLSKAKNVIAISNYIANEIKKTIPELAIQVINPGVDYGFYSFSNESMQKDLKSGYILTQGEFKRRKGYSEMLPIIKKVMDVHPNLKYVIVANKERNLEYQKELYELMEKLDIRDRVIVKGNLSQEDLRETYRQASLYFTLPRNIKGDIEGFGMAIMEAAATGTPAIVGRGSGADDAVHDGESGFLVNGESEDGVVEKILEILDNQDGYSTLSTAAKDWARDHQWLNQLRGYIQIYEKNHQ